MTTYATYSHACLLDEHEACFDTEDECDCQCHEVDEPADGYPTYSQDFPEGW